MRAPCGTRQFWPPRNWWLALLVVLVLAGALRFPGYDFSLPVIDVGDEAHHSLSGRYIIDTGSARALGQDGYPPGIIRLYYLILRFFQEPGSPTTSVIWMVRLLAITASLGTVAVLALLGYHTFGPPYGLLGAAFWSDYAILCRKKPLGNGGDIPGFLRGTGPLAGARGCALAPRALVDLRDLRADDGCAIQIHGRLHGAHPSVVAALEWAHGLARMFPQPGAFRGFFRLAYLPDTRFCAHRPQHAAPELE